MEPEGGVMRVVRLYGPGDVRLGEEAMPRAGPEDSLVEVAAVGLCGSDLHWYGEAGIGDARLERPLVLGHEFAGMVRGGPLDGRLVAVDPAIPCGGCQLCRAGCRNLCPAVRFAGHGRVDGALREFLTWPTCLLHPLPEEMSAVQGALLEPLGVALHALDLGHLKAGASVGVFGCGPIGLLLVQLARSVAAGPVIATDPLPHRRRAALHSGSDHSWDPSEAAALAGIHSVTGGLGVDVAFEVAGTQAAVDTAVAAVRPGGRVVLVGIPEDDRTTFEASLARRKGLTIALVRRMNDAYPRAIRMVTRKAVDLDGLVSGRYPLEQAPAAFAAAAARAGLKTVVKPGRPTP